MSAAVHRLHVSSSTSLPCVCCLLCAGSFNTVSVDIKPLASNTSHSAAALGHGSSAGASKQVHARAVYGRPMPPCTPLLWRRMPLHKVTPAMQLLMMLPSLLPHLLLLLLAFTATSHRLHARHRPRLCQVQAPPGAMAEEPAKRLSTEAAAATAAVGHQRVQGGLSALACAHSSTPLASQLVAARRLCCC